jgi:hypothetical protein
MAVPNQQHLPNQELWVQGRAPKPTQPHKYRGPPTLVAEGKAKSSPASSGRVCWNLGSASTRKLVGSWLPGCRPTRSDQASGDASVKRDRHVRWVCQQGDLTAWESVR